MTDPLASPVRHRAEISRTNVELQGLLTPTYTLQSFTDTCPAGATQAIIVLAVQSFIPAGSTAPANTSRRKPSCSRFLLDLSTRPSSYTRTDQPSYTSADQR